MHRKRDFAALLILASLAWWAPTAVLRWARPVLLNLGPNDSEYLRGFRSEWERDKLTRFHWTTQAASVTLPLQIRGSGHLLRMRVRRHFLDPAQVTLRVEGQTAAAFPIQADPKVAYRVIEISLPPLRGDAPFSLLIQAVPTNPNPLGIAIDWLEVERRGPDARIALLPATRIRLLAVVLLAAFAVYLAGSRHLALTGSSILLASCLWGAGWDVLALERMLREGLPAVAFVGLLGLGLARWAPAARTLGIPTTTLGAALVLLTLGAAAVRLLIVLHPQFYYPDVKVHSLFAWQLVRRGLPAFLREFTANQFRFSLGLQLENGHWYAFPYPPAFYILCWPLIRWAGYRPEVAVSVLAAVVNALETFVVFTMARRLRLSTAVATAAAAAHTLLPIFLARLSLAYFPSLVGHTVDALTILFLVAHLDRLQRPRVVLGLGALLALALLTYTQGLLNFAILLPLFLLLDIAFERTRDARRQQLGLALAGMLGVLLSFAVFYGRYLPTFVQMRKGIPMAEEQILLDKAEAAARVRPAEEARPAVDDDDPFDGPNFDPWRGLRKAAWRLWVFYGVFSPVVVVGLILLVRSLDGRRQVRLVLVWAATYLLLNLASGGFPGPNLVRYNKDLEIVAPLFCIALGAVGAWLWQLRRWLGVVYACGYGGFGFFRAARYLTERFVLER